MHPETIEAENINKFLRTQEKIPLSSEPLFRLTWSEDDLEYRRIHEGKSAGTIVKTKKYPFITNRWMFQQWYPPNISIHEDLPNSKTGGFETLYVFEDSTKERNPLPLSQEVIEFLLFHIRRPESGMLVKSTINDEMAAMDTRFDNYFESEVETSSPIASLLHTKEGIVVPRSYDPNL